MEEKYTKWNYIFFQIKNLSWKTVKKTAYDQETDLFQDVLRLFRPAFSLDWTGWTVEV